MYPKNAWYVACTPDEIADKPLGRQICGEKIVFYRGHEQRVTAVEDFARTAVHLCHWAMSRMATSSAATMAWSWAAMEQPCPCPDNEFAASRATRLTLS